MEEPFRSVGPRAFEIISKPSHASEVSGVFIRMIGQLKTERSAHPFAALWTNILAGLWGMVAAYILFDSLLITHKSRYAFAAIFPLISAWATLERKRWGRLALMGLSLTTVGVFALMAGVYAYVHHPWQEEARTLGSGATSLIVAYGIGTAAAIGLLTLAGVTGFWLCLPHVAAVFNQNKRATLITAQRGIATVLVICWGAAIALAPLMDENNQNAPGHSGHINTGRARPRNANRPNLRKGNSLSQRNSVPNAMSFAMRSEDSDSRR